eukprot:9471009-Pyramimonas_sp.AAC.4
MKCAGNTSERPHAPDSKNSWLFLGARGRQWGQPRDFTKGLGSAARGPNFKNARWPSGPSRASLGIQVGHMGGPWGRQKKPMSPTALENLRVVVTLSIHGSCGRPRRPKRLRRRLQDGP